MAPLFFLTTSVCCLERVFVSLSERISRQWNSLRWTTWAVPRVYKVKKVEVKKKSWWQEEERKCAIHLTWPNHGVSFKQQQLIFQGTPGLDATEGYFTDTEQTWLHPRLAKVIWLWKYASEKKYTRLQQLNVLKYIHLMWHQDALYKHGEVLFYFSEGVDKATCSWRLFDLDFNASISAFHSSFSI